MKNQKLLLRLFVYEICEKKHEQMNSFFNAQSTHFPLVWMVKSYLNNSKIKHFHERNFPLICSDKTTLHEEVLEKMDQSLFTTEIFKQLQFMQLNCLR